jgi:hypothetical protein
MRGHRNALAGVLLGQEIAPPPSRLGRTSGELWATHKAAGAAYMSILCYKPVGW